MDAERRWGVNAALSMLAGAGILTCSWFFVVRDWLGRAVAEWMCR